MAKDRQARHRTIPPGHWTMMTDEYLQATIKVLFHHHKFNLRDRRLQPLCPSPDAHICPELSSSFNLSDRGCKCDANASTRCVICSAEAGRHFLASVLIFVMSQLADVTEERISNRCPGWYAKLVYFQRTGKVLSHCFLSCFTSFPFYVFVFSNILLLTFAVFSLWPFSSHFSIPPSCFPLPPGSGGSREEQRGSAPRGAKDVAFPSEYFQPAGVHPGCSAVPVEHQTLYHMSGNHGSDYKDTALIQSWAFITLICKMLILLLSANYCRAFCAAPPRIHLSVKQHDNVLFMPLHQRSLHVNHKSSENHLPGIFLSLRL